MMVAVAAACSRTVATKWVAIGVPDETQCPPASGAASVAAATTRSPGGWRSKTVAPADCMRDRSRGEEAAARECIDEGVDVGGGALGFDPALCGQ